MARTYNQSVPYGVPDSFAELVRLSDGTLVTPPQPISIGGIIDAQWDDKGTIKESHGVGAYAARLAGGKQSLKISLTVDEISGKALNFLCYGQQVEQRQIKVATTEIIVPSENTAVVTIANRKQVKISRIDSVTSVKINEVAAASTAENTIATGKYQYDGAGGFWFAEADIGKPLEIAYVSNSVDLTLKTTIPASANFNVTLHSSASAVKKNNSSGASLARNAALAADQYTYLKSGIYNFNTSQTGAIWIAHRTHGVTCYTTIGALPAADYAVYLDTGAAAQWVDHVYVRLTSDSGTAMTGVEVSANLTKVASGTPTSGQFKVDTKGYYTFAAADVGDRLEIAYVRDYQVITVEPPESGEFSRDLGVKFVGGVNLNKVLRTTPLAIANNQYAALDDGTYYFDNTNGAQKLLVSYLYEVAATGSTIVVSNTRIGQKPTLRLVLNHVFEDEQITLVFEKVKPTGVGVQTKQEDFAGMKFEFQAAADPETGIVYTYSSTV